MQSSIFNKTGSSIVSGTSLISNKPNLTAKFQIIEETVKKIEADAHYLTKSARVDDG